MIQFGDHPMDSTNTSGDELLFWKRISWAIDLRRKIAQKMNNEAGGFASV